MKNKISTLVILLLVFVTALSSCVEYSPSVNTPGGKEELTGEDSTGNEGDTTDPEDVFTVSLKYDGKPYSPNPAKPIYAQWNDGFSFHKAELDENGVAKIGGLDGDYQVTLSDVPEGYAYDPNAYVATNGNKDIVIELYRIVTTQGKGNELYNCINIRSTGVYMVELTSEKQEIFFEYAPPESGTYSVEAWNDTTANTVNPIANYYGASFAFKQLQDVYDGGGAESSYTKNFKFDVEIADEMISENGQVRFTFGIKATSKNGEYPVKVFFAIKLDGEFSLNLGNAPLVIPQEELVRQPEYGDEYTFVGAEIQRTENGNTANVFDGSMYKLWPKEDGGDNYYHLYSPEDYPETDGFGPILYAYVAAPCRFLDDSFDTLEYRGNKALTVSGTENYKLFIEGFDKLSSDPNPNDLPGLTEPYFCVSICPCRTNATCPGACTEECAECHPDCRRCPEEAIGHGGYANYCNSDGVYGVTEELKEFLQKFSISQWLFFDGNGFVETNPNVTVYAAEDDQWLFACGYYVKD